jgi:hypothetical protein
MLLQGSTGIQNALEAVGAILQAERQQAAVVIVGGAALNLLDIVKRPTRDVDVIAKSHTEAREPEPPDPLPPALTRAARLVAEDLHLDPQWLNTGPALQWRQGLPTGFGTRVSWRQYGGLSVGIAGRRDLVYLKLYAAADSTGVQSVHYQDLVALRPDTEELQKACAWVKTQDASPDFQRIVDEVAAHVRRDSR